MGWCDGMSMRIFVSGLPVPQGSKSVSRTGVMYEANKKLKPWRSQVEAAASSAMGKTELFDGPVTLAIAFAMSRPKSSKRLFPSVKPDLDKLVRAIGDALTGVVYKDDALVIRIDPIQFYVHDVPGALIFVHEADKELDGLDAWLTRNKERLANAI
jgi:Holliday junction resolvase RusA-like endonuclease